MSAARIAAKRRGNSQAARPVSTASEGINLAARALVAVVAHECPLAFGNRVFPLYLLESIRRLGLTGLANRHSRAEQKLPGLPTNEPNRIFVRRCEAGHA